MKLWILIGATGISILGLTGCVNRQAQDQASRTALIASDPTVAVSVQPARVQTLYEQLEITGDVTAAQDVNVGPKQSGKVLTVNVKDGDSVTAGTLIATLDTSQLLDQLHQAQAQVATADGAVAAAYSNLLQARRNAEIGPTKTAASLAGAESQLRAAKTALQKQLAGGRPEERAQAKANVVSAKANLDNQQQQYDRLATLVKEGAIAANQLDTQRAALVSARSQYDSAIQALNIQQRGARPEDVEAAREMVQQAEQTLTTARAQKSLDPLLRDQVQGAQAQLESARAQADAARASVSNIVHQISDMQIRAPFGGKVFGRPAQAGAIAGPGTTIARIVGREGIYFNGQVPSVQIDQVQIGQVVDIRVDGIPGKTFAGHVEAVSGSGQSAGRLFDVRVQVDSSAGILPGMFAHGVIQLKSIPNATVVPTTSIIRRDNATYVYTVQNNVAKKLPVTTGLVHGESTQVKGIPAGTPIIINGQDNVVDGSKVKVEAPPVASEAAGVSGNS